MLSSWQCWIHGVLILSVNQRGHQWSSGLFSVFMESRETKMRSWPQNQQEQASILKFTGWNEQHKGSKTKTSNFSVSIERFQQAIYSEVLIVTTWHKNNSSKLTWFAPNAILFEVNRSRQEWSGAVLRFYCCILTIIHSGALPYF